MRYMLKDNQSADLLLERLTDAAFHVVEGAVPESIAEDIQVGLYVALHQVLANGIVKSPDCGTLPACTDLREENPFSAALSPPIRARV